MKLRSDQQKAVAEVEKAFRSGVRRVLLASHMGSGKTVMGAKIASKYNKVLWISHRNELRRQALNHCGPNVTSVTVQSMLDVAPLRDVDLIVWDECHHSRAEEWQKAVVGTYPDVRMLGLTATPERADGQALGAIFGRMVVAVRPSILKKRGVIVPTLAAVPEIQGGRRTIAMRAEDAVNRYLKDGIAIVFAESVKDAKAIAKRIGHGAECVTATTPKGVRQRALSRLKRGAIRVVTNVDILTEGVDIPAVTMVVLARNFGHRVTYVQAAARAGRAHPGKEYAMVVDLCDNVRRFGLPDEDHEYVLTDADVDIEKRDPTDPLPDEGRIASPFERDPYLVHGCRLIDYETKRVIKESPILPCYITSEEDNEEIEKEVREVEDRERESQRRRMQDPAKRKAQLEAQRESYHRRMQDPVNLEIRREEGREAKRRMMQDPVKLEAYLKAKREAYHRMMQDPVKREAYRKARREVKRRWYAQKKNIT
jgi:DNA repair protein RadD